ncbi:hypothetical protein [Synechococcus sp. M16CYN]|uniref:hypothetical protein n=1 Tax=Synechococcus sp. M16CYN TaxID=3103139 RepID=UPI003340496A
MTVSFYGLSQVLLFKLIFLTKTIKIRLLERIQQPLLFQSFLSEQLEKLVSS